MSWAANAEATGPLKPTERLVLVTMAEPADVQGHRSFLGTPTIARRAGLSERHVTRIVKALEATAHIQRADDQGPAQYLRADRRPIVYDLAMTRITGDGEPVDNPPRGDTDVMTSRTPRGDTQGRHGVTPVSGEPTTEPNYGTTPQTPRAALSTGPCPHGEPKGSHACPFCRYGVEPKE